MKVLFVQPCYEGFGGYFRAIGLAKALAKKGVEVVLLCPSSSRFSFKVKKKTIDKNLTRYELPRWEINFFVNGRICRGFISSLFVFFSKYDLIHFFSSVQIESVIPFVWAKLLAKKSVFDWDDYWQDSPLYHQSGNLVRGYIRFLENWVPTQAETMTVTSGYLEKKAKQLGCRTVLRIINGVDADQFYPISRKRARKLLGIKLQEKILVSFGNTYGGERAKLLFETFREVNRLDGEVKLFFNLNPEEILPDRLVSNLKRNNVLEKIRKTGYIDLGTARGVALLSAADIVLFPLGDSSGERACFPIRIGTYLAGEKIVATLRNRTEVSNTFLLYKCGITGKNIEELARRIIYILDNPKKKFGLRKNILQAKKELSWNNLVTNLKLLYKKINNEII